MTGSVIYMKPPKLLPYMDKNIAHFRIKSIELNVLRPNTFSRKSWAINKVLTARFYPKETSSIASPSGPSPHCQGRKELHLPQHFINLHGKSKKSFNYFLKYYHHSLIEGRSMMKMTVSFTTKMAKQRLFTFFHQSSRWLIKKPFTDNRDIEFPINDRKKVKV